MTSEEFRFELCKLVSLLAVAIIVFIVGDVLNWLPRQNYDSKMPVIREAVMKYGGVESIQKFEAKGVPVVDDYADKYTLFMDRYYLDIGVKEIYYSMGDIVRVIGFVIGLTAIGMAIKKALEEHP